MLGVPSPRSPMGLWACLRPERCLHRAGLGGVLGWPYVRRGSDRRVIEFYGMFINGVTGLLCVGVLAIATAIVELIRMAFHRASPVTVHARDTFTSAHPT
jgi:hypothetical protein